MKKSVLLVSFIIVVSIINSCYKNTNNNPSDPCAAVTDGMPGPLFTAVKTLLQNNCVSCHNNSISNGGMNWTVDCNIVNNKDRIKARAVDNNPGPMPPTGPLPQSDKDKIIEWINAGGKFTD